MSPIDLNSLEVLRSRLSSTASVHLRGEPGYNVRRWAENAEKPAAAVAYPANVDDIVELLAFVQGKGPYVNQPWLDVAVKGGGHSASGASSTDGGLVIDLQPHMHDVGIDSENRLAYVGGGALWKHVDQAAFEHGLAPVAGVFVFRLHPQRPTVFHHFFVFAPRMLPRLIDEVNSWMKHRNDTENGSLTFALCPERKPVIVLQMIYNGDSQEGREKYQRFVDLGPMMHRPETIPYIKLNQLQDAQSAHGENKLLRGNFIPATPIGIPPQLATALFDSWSDFVCANADASKSTVLIELYHPDKFASVPHTDTAFAFRQPNFAVLLTMHWTDPSFTSRASAASIQIDNAFENARALAFSPAKNVGGAYVNYLDEESQVGVNKTRSKFGPNYARLVEVKVKYDPEGVFGKWFAILDSKRRENKWLSETTVAIKLAQETTVQS
ncbi:hypothetical protein FS749_010791 [Ceratobasidium sp. UAMH 11750]|nr:hypothetical protein FS749_010791 [Ceratobasidium sp. UAMH 11750]